MDANWKAKGRVSIERRRTRTATAVGEASQDESGPGTVITDSSGVCDGKDKSGSYRGSGRKAADSREVATTVWAEAVRRIAG